MGCIVQDGVAALIDSAQPNISGVRAATRSRAATVPASDAPDADALQREADDAEAVRRATQGSLQHPRLSSGWWLALAGVAHGLEPDSKQGAK